MEDNNGLAFRLTVAHKEAEQLEELNREAMIGGRENLGHYGNQAERDRY